VYRFPFRVLHIFQCVHSSLSILVEMAYVGAFVPWCHCVRIFSFFMKPLRLSTGYLVHYYEYVYQTSPSFGLTAQRSAHSRKKHDKDTILSTVNPRYLSSEEQDRTIPVILITQ
jgi:hypothetical protein